ncbi:hypothetical protein D9758_017257 [Tetrapyrgos nigripes]|uniref:DUF4219 domain-containing protein n=1 Tax=Tetrapyrgos nigripes TaxID=182062 RepID=A0A8H5FGH2_9AGAR|nr:hypothetical protein D9758_017257 [Tetrapyrgos nigripes]
MVTSNGLKTRNAVASAPIIAFEMSSGSSFMSTVPELTGPNYTLWASKSKSWLQSQGITYVLNTFKPGEIQIVGSTSPVPAPPAAPAGTTGGTTAAAAAATDDKGSDAGSPSPHFIAAASGSVADWEKDNDKAMGVIKLRVTQAIGVKIKNITTARVMWDTLKNLYGMPGAAEIFQNFKRAMNVEIPRNAHPGQTIDLIKMYLTRITNAGANTEIPMYLQYMIVINKLPPDIYAYIIARITQDDVDDFEHETLDSLRTHVVNTWEARGRKKSQSANATKIMAIKRKGKPPVFEEQQQQHHKGGSSAWRGKGQGRGNWRGRGKRAGEQTHQKQQAQSMGPIKLGHSHVIHAAKFFKETPTITVTEPSTKDVRKPFFSKSVKPFDRFFSSVQNAFKTTRDNGLKPNGELLKDLELAHMSHSEASTSTSIPRSSIISDGRSFMEQYYLQNLVAPYPPGYTFSHTDSNPEHDDDHWFAICDNKPVSNSWGAANWGTPQQEEAWNNFGWKHDKCVGTDDDAEMAEEDDRLSDSLISNVGSMNSEEFEKEKEESTKRLRMWEAGLVDMGDSDKENVNPNPRTLQECLQMVNNEMTQRWYSGEFDKEYNDGLEDLNQMSASNSSGWSQARSVTPLFEEISTSPCASNSGADSLPDLITPPSSSPDMDVISLRSDSEEEMISESWNDGRYYSADDEPGRM